MQGLEKAHGEGACEGAASQSFAQLRKASQSFAKLRKASQALSAASQSFAECCCAFGAYALRATEIAVAMRGAFRPSALAASPMRVCEALRDSARFCEKRGYLCFRNASKTRQNGLQAIFLALGMLPYVLAQKTAQNASNRVLAGFMGSEGFWWVLRGSVSFCWWRGIARDGASWC